MRNRSITEKLADSIRMSEPLTKEQCVSAMSDDHSEQEVLAELEACKKLEALKFQTNIVFDKDQDRWCLPGQRLADQEESEDEL